MYLPKNPPKNEMTSQQLPIVLSQLKRYSAKNWNKIHCLNFENKHFDVKFYQVFFSAKSQNYANF